MLNSGTYTTLKTHCTHTALTLHVTVLKCYCSVVLLQCSFHKALPSGETGRPGGTGPDPPFQTLFSSINPTNVQHETPGVTMGPWPSLDEPKSTFHENYMDFGVILVTSLHEK